jgi:isoaspartyl peptidase/L-asparaginase-like protein (Ntn-hydrolase superfamily)
MKTVLATWERPGEVTINAAHKAASAGEDLMGVLEAALAAAEYDPSLIAIGRGGVPNSDGTIELDASVMLGKTLDAGAVCGVQDILPVVSLARMVMEKTEHVMLCGDQARRFAIEQGMKPQNLMTAESCRRFEEYYSGMEGAKVYVHHEDDEAPHDTVTVLGVEDRECAAACSTSGMPFKLPGRVGDSPIIGAGIYADDEAGCAGATGWGEELWKCCASYRVVRNMGAGMSPQEACDETIQYMMRRRPGMDTQPSVVFALGLDGDFGAACFGGDFDLWVMRGDDIAKHHYKSLS